MTKVIHLTVLDDSSHASIGPGGQYLSELEQVGLPP